MRKKYFIRGNKERGSEVIAELEKLGGVNNLGYEGIDKNKIYFIAKDNTIRYSIEKDIFYSIITECFEEIKLPEVFKSEEIVFVTAPATNMCKGCCFDYSLTHCNVFTATHKCQTENIIYKLKE